MSAPQSHEKQSLRLWLHIFSCAGMVERRIQNRFRQRFSTTLPRFDVLAALERAGKPLTMGALSDLLLTSHGNVTGIITRLQKDGLVERTKAPNDARSHIVALTNRGRAYFAELAGAHEKWIDEMFSHLSDDEISAMLGHLGKLRTSLEPTTGEKS
jgi:DNA-binding MarR family transcriptional regulator